jgi:hypothetical protein
VLRAHRFDMSGPLRSALVVLLFVLGVVLLSVCPDGVGAVCEHPCCASADCLRSIQRLIRRLTTISGSALGTPHVWVDRAGARLAHSWSSMTPAQPFGRVSPLRI